MFEAAEIRKMLDNAGPTLKAMILLGVNCGFGCTDCGRLHHSALDLKAGWVTFPRPKTGSERRIPLWPETVAAIKAALAKRPKPATDDVADLVFLTRTGATFAKDSTRYLTDQFKKFLTPLGLHQKGRGFYTLRHVAETIGGESRDQVAVDAIMGHAAATWPHITVSGYRMNACSKSSTPSGTGCTPSRLATMKMNRLS